MSAQRHGTGPAPRAKFTPEAVGTRPDKGAHNFLLGGDNGVGKTFFASTIDRVFIVPIEKSLKGMNPDCSPGYYRVVPETPEELIEALRVFRDSINGHETAPTLENPRPPLRYRHLVLDHLTGIEAIVNRAARKREGAEHMEAKDYKVVWAAALPIWERIVAMLEEVRRTGVNVWILAHTDDPEDRRDDGSASGQKVNFFVSGTGKNRAALLKMLQNWADHILFMTKLEDVLKKKGGAAIGNMGSRVFVTQNTGVFAAKTRSQMPPVVIATWPDLARAISAKASSSDARIRAEATKHIDKIQDVAFRDELTGLLSKAASLTAVSEILERAKGALAIEALGVDEEAPVDAAPVAETLPSAAQDDGGAGPLDSPIPTGGNATALFLGAIANLTTLEAMSSFHVNNARGLGGVWGEVGPAFLAKAEALALAAIKEAQDPDALDSIAATLSSLPLGEIATKLSAAWEQRIDELPKKPE